MLQFGCQLTQSKLVCLTSYMRCHKNKSATHSASLLFLPPPPFFSFFLSLSLSLSLSLPPFFFSIFLLGFLFFFFFFRFFFCFLIAFSFYTFLCFLWPSIECIPRGGTGVPGACYKCADGFALSDGFCISKIPLFSPCTTLGIPCLGDSSCLSGKYIVLSIAL